MLLTNQIGHGVVADGADDDVVAAEVTHLGRPRRGVQSMHRRLELLRDGRHGLDLQSEGALDTRDGVCLRRIVHGDDDNVIHAKQRNQGVPPCKGLRDQSSEVPVDHDRVDVDKIDVQLCAERISYAVFCLKKKKKRHNVNHVRTEYLLDSQIERNM